MGVLNPPFLYGIFDFPLFLSSSSWGSSIFRKPPDDTHGFHSISLDMSMASRSAMVAMVATDETGSVRSVRAQRGDF